VVERDRAALVHRTSVHDVAPAVGHDADGRAVPTEAARWRRSQSNAPTARCGRGRGGRSRAPRGRGASPGGAAARGGCPCGVGPEAPRSTPGCGR
jgi:hypothetical protein